MAWEKRIEADLIYDPSYMDGRDFSFAQLERLKIKSSSQLGRCQNELELTQARLLILQAEEQALQAELARAISGLALLQS